MQTYIIEHLEPKLSQWCLIEYRHISKIVGKRNLWLTNIKLKKDRKMLGRYGKAIEKSASQLNLKDACVLDPEADKALSSKEAKNFRFFVFGGILGDYPARKRTRKQLTKFMKKAAARNIGKSQFSTDNAVFVVRQIVKGKNLKDIKFQDNIEISMKNNKHKGNNIQESFILPYRYALHKRKPLISPELVKFLRKKGF